MKSFSTDNGDVVVTNTIEMVSDGELLRQKVQRVLSTNKGEWAYDPEEGIEFPLILRKNPEEGAIKRTIEEALLRIDSTFTITSFSLSVSKTREATISFSAVNSNGEEVGGDYSYGGN